MTNNMLALLALAAITGANAQIFGNGNFGGFGPVTSTSSGTSSSNSNNNNNNFFGNNGNGNGNGNNGFGGGNQFGNFFGLDFQTMSTLRLAHGVIAALAFVIFFPAGAITIRLVSGRAAFLLHVVFQILAYLLYIVGFAIGVWLAKQVNFGNFNFFSNPSLNYHPIIGIVIFAFLFFQPTLGIIHHVLYKKRQRRQFWSHAHIWLGRLIITAGIINGGLGLYLANNVGLGGIVAYAVVAGIIWLIWIVAAIVGEVRRVRASRRETSGDVVVVGGKRDRVVEKGVLDSSEASSLSSTVSLGAGALDVEDGRGERVAGRSQRVSRKKRRAQYA